MLSGEDRAQIEALAQSFQQGLLDGLGDVTDLLLSEEELTAKIQNTLTKQQHILDQVRADLDDEVAKVTYEILKSRKETLLKELSARAIAAISALEADEERLKRLEDRCDQLILELAEAYSDLVQKQDEIIFNQLAATLKQNLTSAVKNGIPLTQLKIVLDNNLPAVAHLQPAPTIPLAHIAAPDARSDPTDQWALHHFCTDCGQRDLSLSELVTIDALFGQPGHVDDLCSFGNVPDSLITATTKILGPKDSAEVELLEWGFNGLGNFGLLAHIDLADKDAAKSTQQLLEISDQQLLLRRGSNLWCFKSLGNGWSTQGPIVVQNNETMKHPLSINRLFPLPPHPLDNQFLVATGSAGPRLFLSGCQLDPSGTTVSLLNGFEIPCTLTDLITFADGTALLLLSTATDSRIIRLSDCEDSAGATLRTLWQYRLPLDLAHCSLFSPTPNRCIAVINLKNSPKTLIVNLGKLEDDWIVLNNLELDESHRIVHWTKTATGQVFCIDESGNLGLWQVDDQDCWQLNHIGNVDKERKMLNPKLAFCRVDANDDHLAVVSSSGLLKLFRIDLLPCC